MPTLIRIRMRNKGTSFGRILALSAAAWIVFVCCWNVTLAGARTDAVPLQPIIDAAPYGETLLLQPGTYMGPVRIDKKLTLDGGGKATLVQGQNDSSGAVVLIRAEGVSLQGLNIRQDNGGEAAAVRVEAARVSVKGLAVHSAGYGIMLRKADSGVIENNKIRYTVPAGTAPGIRGNGIDLYESDGVRIAGNEITLLRDGIYLEKSRNAVIDGNRLYYSRYGIHCMYIDGSKVTNNIGEYNITGAMVMGVTDVTVSGNSFRKQSRNVHSQGILLYDVKTSRIHGNLVEGNRVGIFMQQSSGNALWGNTVLRNYIGVQFEDAEDNRFQRNGFIANVMDAEAAGSRNNEMSGNYWDSFQGLDLTGDGVSELPYAINPFYRHLVARNSAYQLLFQSPGITFLSDLFQEGKTQWSADPAPLLQPEFETAAAGGNEVQGGRQGPVMVAGCVLVFLSVVTILYLGVFRS